MAVFPDSAENPRAFHSDSSTVYRWERLGGVFWLSVNEAGQFLSLTFKDEPVDGGYRVQAFCRYNYPSRDMGWLVAGMEDTVRLLRGLTNWAAPLTATPFGVVEVTDRVTGAEVTAPVYLSIAGKATLTQQDYENVRSILRRRMR